MQVSSSYIPVSLETFQTLTYLCAKLNSIESKRIHFIWLCVNKSWKLQWKLPAKHECISDIVTAILAAAVAIAVAPRLCSVLRAECEKNQCQANLLSHTCAQVLWRRCCQNICIKLVYSTCKVSQEVEHGTYMHDKCFTCVFVLLLFMRLFRNISSITGVSNCCVTKLLQQIGLLVLRWK